MNAIQTQQISDAFELLKTSIHENAVNHGWYDESQHPTDVEKIMLIFLEVAEVCDTLREGKQYSDHIPGFLALEEELADVVMLVLAYCGWRNLDLAGALLAKMKFNIGREYRHGGKAF